MRAIGAQALLAIGCLIVALPHAYADEPGPQGGPEATPPPQPEKPEKAEPTPPPAPAKEHEGAYLKSAIRPREIVVDIPGVRTTETKLMLYGLAAVSTIASGVGLYFHLQSRSAANDVSRSIFEGETWTDSRQARLDDGERAKTRAVISYTVGGLFVTGTIVALILSEPKSERQVIRPRHAGIAPIPGGAIAGAGWKF